MAKMKDSPLVYDNKQNLTDREETILKTGERLLNRFSERTISVRTGIRTNRKIWALNDPNQTGSSEGEEVVQLPTLVSNIVATVADQVDNMPDVQLLPEEPGSKDRSDQMADVLHYIFDRREYRRMHPELMTDMLVAKACVIQTFWDPDLNDGEGDVDILRWPIENFYWDPDFDDLQEGRACFKVAWFPKSWFEEHYPDEYRYISFGRGTDSVLEPENIDNDDQMTMLAEYWYKRYDAAAKKTMVHVAKFAGGAMLECSEKDTPDGIYAHGLYPFDVHSYRPISGSLVGRSMIDDFVEVQRRANRFSHYIDANGRMSARYKTLTSKDAILDRSQLTDWNQPIVEVNGGVSEERVRQMTVYPLNPQIENHMLWLLETQKRESGQNESARGEFGGGITAASAIQALQEAGNKVSRFHTFRYQQTFKSLATKVLWLAAQYYKKDRVVVITGDGENKPDQEITVGHELIYGKRIPKDSPLPAPPFTVEVIVQRANPQRIDIENQWVLQIAQMFVQNGQQMPVSSVIRMLTLPGKDRLLRAALEVDARTDALTQMQGMIEQLQQQLAQTQETNNVLSQELVETMGTLDSREAVQPDMGELTELRDAQSVLMGGTPNSLPTLP